MASGLSTTRAKLKALLATATDDASLSFVSADRILLGWNARAITDPNLYDDLTTTGPLAIVGLVDSIDYEWTDIGPAMFPFTVFIAKSKSSDWEGTDVLDFIGGTNGIIAKLTDQSQYTAGATAPDSVVVEGYNYDTESSQGILAINFSFRFLDPIQQSKKTRGEQFSEAMG